MTWFELIKQVVRIPEAAAYYGLHVSRNGMACCPFHDDRHPSMKLNERYFYCFGCGATGDVIDLVAKLFGLSSYEAAKKLAHDFGIDPDKPPAAIALPKPERPLLRAYRQEEMRCLRVLCDYLHLLESWKVQYTPKTPEDTTLDIYTHITGDMLSEAAAKIDRGLGNEVAEDSSAATQNPLADFHPVMRRTRKPGTGCITQINDHLFEGRYSPTWPDGTKHSKCVYAHTREECEEKLKVLIQQLNAERKAIQNRMRGIVPPEKLTKKQRQIWEYMKIYPDETNYSTIAKGAKVTRHTVAKHYEMIQKMLGIQKTAPHPLLDCQTVPLMV